MFMQIHIFMNNVRKMKRAQQMRLAKYYNEHFALNTLYTFAYYIHDYTFGFSTNA